MSQQLVTRLTVKTLVFGNRPPRAVTHKAVAQDLKAPTQEQAQEQLHRHPVEQEQAQEQLEQEFILQKFRANRGSNVISASAAKSAAASAIAVSGATTGTPKLSSDKTYYTVPILKNGKTIGAIEVNAKTGEVTGGYGNDA